MQNQHNIHMKQNHTDFSRPTAEKGEGSSLQQNHLDNHNDNHHNFTVAVRIKPKDPHEENVKIIINKNCKEMSIETFKQAKNSYYGGKCKTFKMDAIFEQKVTNDIIFNKTVKQKLEILKANRNIALMAYGATNSGKTYTILGSGKSSPNRQEGLAHLSYRYLMEDLFQGSFKFYFSYLEIYNENIQDLLCDQERRHNLNVFQDHSGKINIPQLTRIEVPNYNSLCKLIEIGSIARAESSNNINKLSSRSHAILQLEIFSAQDGDSEVIQMPIDVNFMVIDLAGSEKSTPYFQESQQATLKEGSNINRSLLALGNCIKNLANGQPHIPYRNSKLTRLLKENLSGSCHNIMIACISHSTVQFQESISTLQYASKACHIEIAKSLIGRRDRGKFVTIPCQHCKMSIDFSYLCKVFKQHAFNVVDQLTGPRVSPKTSKQNEMPRQQKKIENLMRRIKILSGQPEKLDLLNKLAENIENADPKVEIHIQQTEDSQKQNQRIDQPPQKSLLKIKTKLNLNVDRPTKRLSIKNDSLEDKKRERQSRSRSEKSVKLRLKQRQVKQKTKQKIEKQPSTSYIKIQQPPKSFNISSIKSRQQDISQVHSFNHDNYIQPFLPQLSFDMSQFLQPKDKLFNGRIQKDFQGIQFVKQKRSSDPRYHLLNKENSQLLTNTADISDQGSNTYRDSEADVREYASHITSFENNKELKRMKPDIISHYKQNPVRISLGKNGQKDFNECQQKSKIKLLSRMR